MISWLFIFFLPKTCFLLYAKLLSLQLSLLLSLTKFFTPGPALASTTCAQCCEDPRDSFLNLLTNKTQALQISPHRWSVTWKQLWKKGSYFLLAVNRELLDLALQMQQPARDLCTERLCRYDISWPEVSSIRTWQYSMDCGSNV